jgi:hypothetical protein
LARLLHPINVVVADQSLVTGRMLDYVRLTPGRGFKPMRAALYYAQRLLVHPGLRASIVSCIAAVINWKTPPARRPSLASDSSHILASIKTNGWAFLPTISPEQVEDIKQYLADKPVVLRDRKVVPLSCVPPDCTVADYPLETVLGTPHFLEMANAPANIEIATQYFGCLPTISSVGIRWSLPGDREQATTQKFHRDLDDWRCLKFFVYLTDVDLTSGPHHYVPGSQRTAASLFARPIGHDYIDRTFGLDNIRPVTGPAGTAFMVDVNGIHAGPIPTRRPRLMLTVGYTILPVFAMLYKKPLTINSTPAVDKYINRLFVECAPGGG